jgi:4-alpha-glucanotransferase
MNKQIGIVTPLFSLPSPHGIGDIESLYQLIGQIIDSDIKLIQLLPINIVTEKHRCPYLAMSAFAFDPIYISLSRIPWIKKKFDVPEFDQNQVDYKNVWAFKYPLLKDAYSRFLKSKKGPMHINFEGFKAKNSEWLIPYCEFHVLSLKYGQNFRNWPMEFRHFDQKAKLTKTMQKQMEFYAWLQWIFYLQWMDLRTHANRFGIRFMGDLPIGISKDSSDQWCHPELFKQDVRIGLPPDPSHPDGQRWGMSAYCWDAMRKDNFHWWRKRLQWLREVFDEMRLDHFQAFHATWEVPEGKLGKDTQEWTPGPKSEIVPVFKDVDFDYVIEDLGFISHEVHEWFHSTGFDGYRVFLYGWGCYAGPEGHNKYTYAEHYDANTLATTSTHDSESYQIFLKNMKQNELVNLAEYLEYHNPSSNWNIDLVFLIFKKLLESKSRRVTIPLYDIFCQELVVNHAGTNHPDNWKARIHWGQHEQNLLQRFKGLVRSVINYG